MPHPHAVRPRAWLGLGEASELIGVDPDTLRRWADEGRVEVYHTPGGHRRFQRRSLERLMRARPRARVRISRLGPSEARLVAAYRRAYLPSDGESVPDAMAAVPESDRSAFRENGRQLVAALVAYLDSDGAARRGALEVASASAAALGRDLAAAGVSLTDAVALFIASRKPFMAQLGAMASRRALDSRQVAQLFDRASSALDRCMLRFVAGHQSTP
jgi:excisionase family DNA binding protein